MKRETFNHGFTEIAWNAAKKEAREAMIAVAQAARVITYSDLAYKKIKSCTLEPHDPRLAQMIEDISTEENEAGRGMLSAVVVNKRDGRPGPGFFTLARLLGRDADDELRCWSEELSRVYNACSR